MSFSRSRAVVLLVACAFIALVAATLTGPVLVNADAATTAAKQRGVTTLSPPVVQPGKKAESSAEAKLSGTVRFKPAKKGRPVKIQRSVDGGKWQTVAKKKQNKAGKVSFTAAAYAEDGSPYRYRGFAPRWRGRGAVEARSQSAAVWATKFKDEFAILDPTKWLDRVSNAPSRPCAKVGDPRAREVSGGTLRLRSMYDPEREGETCETPEGNFRYYLNGQISTEHIPHAFTYGTFAARIKFQEQRGQHGSFWLQPVAPQPEAGKPAQSGAEIDIVEFFGKGYPDGGLASFLYNYGVVDQQGKPVKIGGMVPKATRMLPKKDAWWKRYHVFSVEWTKKRYTFSVDGRPHYSTKRGVSGIDEYLILSMLTSNWELKQAKNNGVKPIGSMYVDWARVWQKGADARRAGPIPIVGE